MYDLIVVGGGPAGVTASIYAKRAGLNVLLLEGKFVGGQIINSHNVENYPGYVSISGFELSEKFSQQLSNLEIQKKSENVIAIDFSSDIKKVVTKNNEYTGKTIIIATGAAPRKLGVYKEELFVGAGVSYCATCDGAFFKNKDVAVVGGGNTAIDDAMYLSKFCNKIYLIHRRDEFRANKTTVEKVKNTDKIELILNSQITRLKGDNLLTGVEINNKEEININGLFVAVGNIPNTEFIKDNVTLDESGFILTNSSLETNVKGVFAAGDVVKKDLRQVVTAVSDGAIAVQGVLNYLGEQ